MNICGYNLEDIDNREVLHMENDYINLFATHLCEEKTFLFTYNELLSYFEMEEDGVETLVEKIWHKLLTIVSADVNEYFIHRLKGVHELFIADRGVYLVLATSLNETKLIRWLYVLKKYNGKFRFVDYFIMYNQPTDVTRCDYINGYYFKSSVNSFHNYNNKAMISLLIGIYESHHKYSLSDPLSIEGGKEILDFTQAQLTSVDNMDSLVLYLKDNNDSLVTIDNNSIYYLTTVINKGQKHLIRASHYKYEFFGELAYSVKYVDCGCIDGITEGTVVSRDDLQALLNAMSVYAALSTENNKLTTVSLGKTAHGINSTSLKHQLNERNSYKYHYTEDTFYTVSLSQDLCSIRFVYINQYTDFVSYVCFVDESSVDITKLLRYRIDLDSLISPNLVALNLDYRINYGEAAMPFMAPYFKGITVIKKDDLPLLIYKCRKYRKNFFLMFSLEECAIYCFLFLGRGTGRKDYTITKTFFSISSKPMTASYKVLKDSQLEDALTSYSGNRSSGLLYEDYAVLLLAYDFLSVVKESFEEDSKKINQFN